MLILSNHHSYIQIYFVFLFILLDFSSSADCRSFSKTLYFHIYSPHSFPYSSKCFCLPASLYPPSLLSLQPLQLLQPCIFESVLLEAKGDNYYTIQNHHKEKEIHAYFSMHHPVCVMMSLLLSHFQS